MRLYVKHIWRAFPELDRFSDEQCKRFTRAARRSRPLWLRLLHWLVQWAAWAACAFAGLALMGLLEQWTYSVNQPLGATYVWIALSGVVCLLLTGCGVLAWLLVSHLFLRRRIAWVLRARGRCAGCKYVLVGLPVGQGNLVVCPECGFEAEVDRSLGELSVSADGRERYTPSADVLKRSEPWPDWRKVWKWGKRGLVVVGTLAVVAGIAAGWRELWVRGQVSGALQLKPGAAGYVDLLAANRGVQAAGDGESTLVLIDKVSGKMGQVLANTYSGGTVTVDGEQVYLDADSVAERHAPWHNEDWRKSRGVSERYSGALLAEFERNGIFDDLAAALRAERLMPPMRTAASGLLNASALINYYELRNTAGWCGARARVAVRDDNPRRFVEAVGSVFGLAEVLDSDPTITGRLTAATIEDGAYELLRRALSDRRDGRWLDAIESVFTQHERLPSRKLAYEGERVFTKDLVCLVFSDADCVRFGRYGHALDRALGGLGWGRNLPPGKLGSVDENLSALDAYFDRFVVFADTPRWQRDAAILPATSSLLLVDVCTGGMVRSLDRQDQIEFERAAFPVLLVIERFRLTTGAYPATLRDIAPLLKAGLPVDPWTGKGWGYRLVDPAKDEQGRGFLFYSFGRDGVDDGGTPAQPAIDALYGRGMPCDLIINDNFR